MRKGEMIEILVNHYCDGNKAKFAAKIGVRPQTINTWISRDSFDAELIYSKCEGIKAEWLLTGEGETFNDPSISQTGDNSGALITGDVTINAAPSGEAEVLKERVAALQERIGEKDALIAEKERIIGEKERLVAEKQQLIDEKERTIRFLLGGQK